MDLANLACDFWAWLGPEDCAQLLKTCDHSGPKVALEVLESRFNETSQVDLNLCVFETCEDDFKLCSYCTYILFSKINPKFPSKIAFLVQIGNFNKNRFCAKKCRKLVLLVKSKMKLS